MDLTGLHWGSGAHIEGCLRCHGEEIELLSGSHDEWSPSRNKAVLECIACEWFGANGRYRERAGVPDGSVVEGIAGSQGGKRGSRSQGK